LTIKRVDKAFKKMKNWKAGCSFSNNQLSNDQFNNQEQHIAGKRADFS
jgi:hypothetical protein